MNKIINKQNKNKKAFTLAEAVIALAVIGIVVSASVPLVTGKLNSGANNGDASKKMWGASSKGAGQGLVTSNSVSIGNFTTAAVGGVAEGSIVGDSGGTTIANFNTSLSYYPDRAQSLLNNIRAERPLFKVGSFNFAQIRDNIFITTSDVPNTSDTNYPPAVAPAAGSLTCFNTADCSRNIVLGGQNYNSTPAAAGGNEIINYAVANFSDNTIIGHNNHNISNVSQNSFIAGFSNNAGGNAIITTTMVGNSNTATKANQVIIGHGNTAPTNINIGAGDVPSIISYKAADNAVHFSKSTIIDENINANSIILTSDKRLKNIKGEYKKGLKEVLKVEPVFFTFKSDKTNELQVGVIAQDLQKIFPEAVVKRDDGYLAVKDFPVFFALLNSVKELNTNYEKIKQNNDEIEKQIAHLKLNK